MWSLTMSLLGPNTDSVTAATRLGRRLGLYPYGNQSLVLHSDDNARCGYTEFKCVVCVHVKHGLR